MNGSLGRRKATASYGSWPNKKKKPNKKSSFFEPIDSDPKSRRKTRKSQSLDEVIESDDDDSEYEASGNVDAYVDEEAEETAVEKRYRLAKEKIEKLKTLTKKVEDEDEVLEEYRDGRIVEDEEEDIQGRKRDVLLASILQKEQLELSGRVQRLVASRVLKPDQSTEFHMVSNHRQSVTAVALTEDDTRGFSASKDGAIFHWDVESGKRDKYLFPHKEDNAKNTTKGAKRQSKNVLALAVSSDGRYLVSGGLDRLVHLWDTRTRTHLQEFQGHKGPVSCLAFRQGTSDLFSGSFDRMIKWWNVEDRCHVNNLFGHQAEVLTIDCLRKERILSVGHDRTLRLFKVLEESSLRFSTSTSALESCCFINNDEFLSGSDDGSVELWNMLRRKPVYIVKNAHPLPDLHDRSLASDNTELSNGRIETGEKCSSAQSWVSTVTVCKGSDLAASGAGNGFVRLWALESEVRSIRPLYELPLVGFVNSLAFASSGRFLLAGVGKEPRLGRWGRISSARNGVSLFPLNLSEEAQDL